MGKNKNRGRDNRYQSQGIFGNNKPKEKVAAGSLPVSLVKEEPKVTVETVAKSETQEAFEANKAALVKQFEQEVEQYQQMADEAKKEYDGIKQSTEVASQDLQKAQEDLESKRAELGTVSASLEKAKTVVAEAEENAAKVLEKANQEAADIRAAAIADAANERAAAQAKVQESLKEANDKLKEREDSLEEGQKNLEECRRKLKKDQFVVDMQKQELDVLKNQLDLQKDLYSKANPVRLEELERSLGDEKAKYEQLRRDYDEQRDKFHSQQIEIDAIRVEISDPQGGKTEYAVRSLLDEARELKETLARKTALLDQYPSEEDIFRLETEAKEAADLKENLRKAEQQKDEYKLRYEAEHNLAGELASTKRELDATRALNEHLLQELEKNKTALENRTGNVCPSLTKVDDEVEEDGFKEEIARKTNRPVIKKLDELVDAVYNYAGCGTAKEKLYYEKDDLRSFLAGMAVSKLIIIKGMSGTGKSSLPRIFSKAISGNHNLIPVESSWRDRNELLGYYNDFNKLFNAKSFTIELYRSGKTPDIPSFIVLDEMNLARIEYYFSDFLAKLEEPDREKWLVELVSSDMRTLPFELSEKVEAELRKTGSQGAYELWCRKKKLREGNTKVAPLSAEEEGVLKAQLAKLNALIGAKDLIDGRKLRIPQNVWFVGTANEDESTFEISDKVYDRAQVLVLNKKGKPDPGNYVDTVEQFISYGKLQELFDSAIRGFKEEDTVKERLEKIDEVLINKFNVSFGNRIVTQATQFAAVFTAAKGTLEKALDYQISTKILRKVYHTDDVDAFSSLLNVCDKYETTSKSIQNRIDKLSR